MACNCSRVLAKDRAPHGLAAIFETILCVEVSSEGKLYMWIGYYRSSISVCVSTCMLVLVRMTSFSGRLSGLSILGTRVEQFGMGM